MLQKTCFCKSFHPEKREKKNKLTFHSFVFCLLTFFFFFFKNDTMLTVLLIKKINKFQRLNASSCLSLVFLPCTTYLYYLVIEAKPPETLVSIKRQKSSCTCVILFISLLTHQCLDLWRKKKMLM